MSGSNPTEVVVANPNLIVYTFDPHVSLAIGVLCWAIIAIVVGWIIDVAIEQIRKNFK